MPVLNPDHLLDQADRLLVSPSGGAPRQADLRRAISTAYYALFHAIALAAADEFIGRSMRRTPIYALVYRRIDHQTIRKVCDSLRNANQRAKYMQYMPNDVLAAELSEVATAVVELQEKRHSADYDPLFSVKVSDALVFVRQGRDALASLREISPGERKAFLSMLLFGAR